MLKKIISLSIVAFLFAAMANFTVAEEGMDAKQIFEDNKCNLCHSIESQGIEAKKKSDKYPDLSHLSGEYEDALLIDYLHKKESINDKKHPMPLKGSDEELATLVTWLKTLSAEKAEEAAE